MSDTCSLFPPFGDPWLSFSPWGLKKSNTNEQLSFSRAFFPGMYRTCEDGGHSEDDLAP